MTTRCSSSTRCAPSPCASLPAPSHRADFVSRAQFIRDHYLPRFPELDSLVSSPLPYCRVILALGNGPELQGDIAGILPSGSVMAVKVTAATTKGQQLSDTEWNVVKGAVDLMFSLDQSKRTVRLSFPALLCFARA